MRRALLLCTLVFSLSAGGAAQTSKSPKKSASLQQAPRPVAKSPAALQAARASFAALPLSFEQNQGQTDGRVKYLSRGAGYNLFLTADEAVIALRGGNPGAGGSSGNASGRASLWLKMLGANSSAQVSGSDLLPGKINYYVGNDPSKWRIGVRQYGRVTYSGIYPGVDLTYYGNQQQLESDFVVAPGADPRSIEFEVAGARETRLDDQGNLVLATSAGDVQLLRPGIYQVINGVRHQVAGRYSLRGKAGGKDRVGFEIAKYDTHSTLIIDPTLVYATYLGGSNTGTGDGAQAIAVDGSGHAYVTGAGASSDFPGSDLNGPPNESLSGFAFVTELDATGSSGTSLVYSTILSGTATNFETTVGNGIGVDGSGKAYIAGTTGSSNFPMVNPFQATFGGASNSGFVAGLNTDGTLIYSTYFGGRNGPGAEDESDVTILNGLFADSTGNAYVVGNTTSQNFPTVNPFQSTLNVSFPDEGQTNVVVAKFDKNGQPVYSTYLNGTNSNDVGNAIVADSAGNAYVTGQTVSANFPIQSSPVPFQKALNGTSADVFVTKLSFSGSALTVTGGTYLGGASADEGWGIAVDTAATPNVYVTGQTNSNGAGASAFPTKNPIYATNQGTTTLTDAFVTKISGDFTSLVYSTYLGGTAIDIGYDIALDNANPPNAYVTGSTASSGFPVVNPLQAALGNAFATNAFVTEVNGAGSALVFSTFLGGISGDVAHSIALDTSNNMYVAGKSASVNFPVMSGGAAGTSPFQGQLGTSQGNAFIAKISPAAPPSALTFFPPSYNFHTVGLAGATGFTTEQVTLTNNTGASVTINGFNVGGTNSADFTIQSATAPCSTTASFALPAGASCSLIIRFTPMDQDLRSGQISINSTPTSSTVLNLTGTGGVPQVSLNPATISFFPNPDPLNVEAAAGVTVTNTGGGPLLIGSLQIQASTPANAAPFSVISGCPTTAIAPGGSCFIELGFTPTAAITYSATLLINDNVAGSPQTLSLSGAGVQKVVVQPTSLEFGLQVVNSTSMNNANEYIVENGSGGTITLTVTPGVSASQGDFHVNNTEGFNTCMTGTTLAPGGECETLLYFQPAAASATDGRTGSYTVAWSGPIASSQVVNLMGTGVTGISLLTNTLTAPDEFVGFTESTSGLEALYNGTNNPITVNITLGGNNPNDFSVSLDSTCAPAGVVPANTYCRVNTSFTPSAIGLRSVIVSFDYTGDGGDPLILNASGTGIPGPVLITVNGTQTSTHDFGSEIIGTTTPEAKFLVRNVAEVPLTISSITSPGNTDFKIIAADTTCAAGTVPAGGSCVIALTFTPSTNTNVQEKSTFILTDTYASSIGADMSSPHMLTVTGTGEPAVITISVSNGGQNLLDFGNVAINPTTVPSAEIFLTNAGSSPTTITWAGGSPVLNTPTGTQFALGSGGTIVTTCTQSKVVLPEGGSCDIVVTFDPTTTGEQTNSVTFSDSVGGSHTVNIQGNGVGQGKISLSTTTSVTSSDLTFNQLAGTTSAPQTVTVANLGTAPLTITSMPTFGTNTSSFNIVQSSTPCSVGTILQSGASGNTCALNITFTAPATPGNSSEELEVLANLGNNVSGDVAVEINGTSDAGGISLSPAGTISFGPVAVGSTAINNTEYSLTNNFPTTVTFGTMSLPAGYTTSFDECSGQPLTAGNNCFFELSFTPTSSTTNYNGTLSISYTGTGVTGSPFTVGLQGSGSTAVTAIPNPLSITFASIGNQAFVEATLANGSASTATITGMSAFTGANPTVFSIPSIDNGCPNGTALTGTNGTTPGGECFFEVAFLSSTAGNFSAQFTVSYSVSGTPQTPITIVVNASIPSAQIMVSPTTLTFPSQSLNTQSQPLAVTITNLSTSTQSLSVNNFLISNNEFAIAAGSGSCNFVAAGSSCTVLLTFTPSQASSVPNDQTGTFTIVYNNSGNTQAVSLKGTGAAGTVSASPSSLTFPQINIGSSESIGAIISNTTSQTVTISSIVFPTGFGPNPGAGSTCVVGAKITAVTGTCVLYVPFSPTASSNSGTATISYGGTSPVSIALSGTGSNPVVAVSPSPLTFTTGQLLNTSSAPMAVTLTNGTSSTITISRTPTISGDFQLGTNTCTSTVAANGGTCTVNVIFHPTATGTRTGTLTITDSPDTLSPHSVTLNGTGIATDVTITKSHTGNFIVGQTGTYTITVTNAGGAPTTGMTTVTDTLPTGMTFNSNTNTGVWTCSPASQTVTCTSSAVIAATNGTSTFNMVVNVASAAAGTPTNSVTVTTVGDTGTTGKTSADQTTVTFPLPTITSLSPTSATAGGAAFTLTVNGTNFVSGSTVSFNATATTTTFVSATQLTAAVTAAEIATAGTFNVTVANPAPGGGTSGPSPFTVNNPVPTVTSLSPANGLVGGAAFTLTVNGTNFNSSSVVTFNGTARTTTHVSSTQVTIQVTTADLAALGNLPLFVTNPIPGGGVSSTVNLPVTNPPPTITTLAPTSATAGAAGFTLTVTGTGFVSGAVVNFNGIATTTTFVSSTGLTAAITAGDIVTAGTVNVTVTNPAPGGGTSAAQLFTINNPLPTTTSLSPASATAGGAAFTLTVNGTNFNSSSVVTFNGSPRTTTLVSATQVTIQVTTADIATGGTLTLTVANPAPGGGTSASQTFTVNNPLPTITSLSPTTGTKGGTAFTLTVNGTNFVPTSAVTFNGTSRTTTFVSATQVTIQVTTTDLATAGAVNVSVTNPQPAGGTTANLTFTVNNPLPAITSLSPASALVGGAAFTLTVNGTSFVSGATVNFNGTPETTTFVSATQLTASIPSTALTATGTFNVTVTNPIPGGGISGPSPFAVNNPVPTITSLSPNNALVGGTTFTLTVNGTSFVSGAAVTFNGTVKTTTFVSATQVTAQITTADLATAGTVNVTVANPTPGGGASGPSTFTVNNPAPTITSLSPNGVTVGGSGFTLTVTGTGFVSSSVVNFNGTARATTFVSSTQLHATILQTDIATVGSVNVTVTSPTPGGGTTTNFTFNIASAPNPVPTLTSISPTSGLVGQSVNMTLTGTNFIAGSIVNFGANGDTGGTATNGGATLTITIPASQLTVGGPVSVTVTNPTPGGGTTTAQTFTVNNPVPAITTLSPATAVVGGAALTLTVNGSSFVPTSTVSFNGTNRTTTFVNTAQLTIQVTTGDLAAAGTFPVTVTNPAPGGGTSAATNFSVTNPLPTITSVSPTSATAGAAGFTLTVNGTGFVSGASVSFNGTAATTTFVSATQVTASITAAEIATAGTLNVTVTNPAPGGGTSGNSTFTVNNPLPTATSISPTSALAGGATFTLTVNGTNFNSSSVVNFNGTAETTSLVSATQVTASIPATAIAAAGTFNVTVTNPNPGGGTSATVSFSVTNPVPTATSLSPASTTVGGAALTLTVNGTNFVATSAVSFNGTPRTTTFVSGTQLTIQVTAADIATAGTFNVSVTNPPPGGGTSANLTFTVNNPAPTITTLSPTSATKGGATFTLTVNGTNFVASSTVNFNGTAETTTFVSATQLTASIPATAIAAAGTFNVTVTSPTPGGGTSANSTFTVNNPVPTITTFSPASATAGGAAFTLTVNGTGFISAATVTFNSISRASTFMSATQLTTAITAADIATGGTFNVTVTNPAPTTGPSTAQTFTVNNPTPAITTISPTSATAGTAAFTLTVNGTGFVSTSVVSFNGTAAPTTFVSATQLTAAITAANIATGGTFNVTVTSPTPGGGTSGNSQFTVNNPVPTITTLSPTSAVKGAAGFTLTVNGTNFNSSSVVNFNGATTTTTLVSTTQVTAAIPASAIAATGTFNVTVTNPAPAGGTSPATTFNVTDFSVALATTGTVNVTGGTPSTVTLNVTTTPPNSPLPATVSFTCAVATGLTGAGCTLNPTSLAAGTVIGANGSPVVLTITTTASLPPASQPRDPSTPYYPWIAITALAGLMAHWLSRQQRFAHLRARPAYLTLALLLIAGAGLLGCTTAQNTSTPKGASSVTVTATSAGVQKTVTININVQ